MRLRKSFSRPHFFVTVEVEKLRLMQGSLLLSSRQLLCGALDIRIKDSPHAAQTGVVLRVIELRLKRTSMRAHRHMIATGFAAAALLSAAAVPAHAACTRLGFSVNDYGKEGPIKDAKALLDRYVAKWAADRNIAKYRTGPKSVNCELFLDVIVFDEHTCRAEATVCWDGPALAKPQSAGGGDTAQPEAKPAAKPAKASDGSAGSVKRSDVPAGAIKVQPSKIETGTLPVPTAAPAKPAALPPVAVPVAVTPKAVGAPAKDVVVPVAAPAAASAPNTAADQAVLAAEKAAAAAERAALAAERAAAAAAKLEPSAAAKP
jgi:hypothetical protein